MSRGILTERDRELLESDDGASRSSRFRLRERVQNAIRDFTLLYDNLDEVEHRKIFNDLVEAEGPEEAQQTLDYAKRFLEEGAQMSYLQSPTASCSQRSGENNLEQELDRWDERGYTPEATIKEGATVVTLYREGEEVFEYEF